MPQSQERLPRYVGPGIILVAVSHLSLLALWDLAANPYWMLGAVAAGLTGLTLLARASFSPRARTVLAGAVLARALLVPVPATLSEDADRYLWDGQVAQSGRNPYVLAPSAPELDELRRERPVPVPHAEVATVYPPLALTLFRVAAASPFSPTIWKILVVLADLAGCWFLCLLARRRNGSLRGVVWYAWNPLVALEFAGMGHVDAVAIAALLGTLWLLQSGGDRRLAALAAAAGILAKLMPLVALPSWARASGRPWRFLTWVVVVVALAYAPVVASARGVPSGYATFGVSWEYNGPIYEPLWRGLDRLDSRERVAAALDRVKERSGGHDFWSSLYPRNYPKFHARLLLAPLALLLVARSWRHRDPVRATGGALEAVLVCSATVYPWYTLWLLPLAALLGFVPWLLLAGCGVLSYLAQFANMPLMPMVFLACWAPYAVTRVLAWRDE